MWLPRVSVIVSNYNYARYLEIAVNSVLSQTYTNIELIIVDDGSTDTSSDILLRYEHWALIVHQRHGGETSSRNEGYRHATGEIVAFLDADDYWKPDAVAKVLASWRPGLGKLQFALKVVDHEGRPTGGRMPRLPLTEGRVEHLLLTTGRYITSPTSGNFYSREFLDSIFPVPVAEWPQSMDSYAATYAAFYGPIRAIHEELGCYRVHSSNMTRVSGDGQVHPQQIQRLMERGLRLRHLIEQIAQERHLVCSPGIVTSHWLYLKLDLARSALSDRPAFSAMWPFAKRMLRSVLTSPDLDWLHRVQWVAWILAVVVLPARAKHALIRLSFDLASNNPFARVVRLT
jgi:glycosyltransferase involved in cell wall biosynthesis